MTIAVVLWLYVNYGYTRIYGTRVGRVLDTTSNLPVQNASVTLRCQKNKFHGSRTIRTVSVKTDKNGEFQFSLWYVRGCDFGFIKPSKKGYETSGSIHVGYSQWDYQSVPAVLYLTKNSDVRMLRLEALAYPFTSDTYSPLYRNFVRSKAIAETDREIQYVVDKYCGKLASLYVQLNASEKATIASRSYSFVWQGVAVPEDHNYKREVVRFCSFSTGMKGEQTHNKAAYQDQRALPIESDPQPGLHDVESTNPKMQIIIEPEQIIESSDAYPASLCDGKEPIGWSIGSAPCDETDSD